MGRFSVIDKRWPEYSRWREVLLLVAGLIDPADELLLQMETKIQEQAKNTVKLQNLLRWVDEITGNSEGDFNSLAKRGIAIAMVRASAIDEYFAMQLSIGSAIDIASNIVRQFPDDIGAAIPGNIVNIFPKDRFPFHIVNAIANELPLAIARANSSEITITVSGPFNTGIARVLDIARVFDSYKIFNNVSFTTLMNTLKIFEDEIPQGFISEESLENVCQTWILDLKLTPELLNLSAEEWQALDNYLLAIHFLIECKQAARCVSPSVWEDIEARLLRANG